MSLSTAIELPWRALQLAALTLAPALGSPEPAPAGSDRTVALAALSLAAIALVLAGAGWVRKQIPTPEATAAVLFWVGAVAACSACAATFRGDSAPLARGVWYVAPFVYGAIAATAATLAGWFLGSRFKNKRTAATVVVLAGGLLNLQSSAELLASEEAMWRATLERVPGHPLAVAALGPEILADSTDRGRALRTAEACLAREAGACACLLLRAEARLRGGDYPGAETDADQAIAADCAPRGPWEALRAETLARTGRAGEALALLDRSPAAPEPRADYVRAIALASKGEITLARVSADASASAGYGPESELLAGELAARAGDWAAARRWLEPVVHADTTQGDAYYWLAKSAEHERKWDRAIVYLKDAIRAAPTHADARYDLVVLSWRRGHREEARRQASSFASSFPLDPRARELSRLVAE